MRDCFRSQFRVTENAPKSDLDVVKFGLTFIADLRNAVISDHQRAQQDKKTTAEIKRAHGEITKLGNDMKNARITLWVSIGTLVIASLALFAKLAGWGPR